MTPQRARMSQGEPTHREVATRPRSSRDGWEDGAETRELESTPDLDTFARIHGIEVEHISLTLTDPGWVAGLRRRNGPTFLAWFGRTHSNRTTIADILAYLASDAIAVETAISADDWAQNSGLSGGQNLRHKYLTARRQATRLRAWLPVGAYETLLWDINHT